MAQSLRKNKSFFGNFEGYSKKMEDIYVIQI